MDAKLAKPNSPPSIGTRAEQPKSSPASSLAWRGRLESITESPRTSPNDLPRITWWWAPNDRRNRRSLSRGSRREVVVLERRSHVGGNVHDHRHPSGVRIHIYGPITFAPVRRKSGVRKPLCISIVTRRW